MRIGHGKRLALKSAAAIRAQIRIAAGAVQGECWEWSGHVDERGYGQVWFGGRAHWAHRVAFAAFIGPIRAGYDVHHKCRNRCCVRPDHLEAVPASVNRADGAAAGWIDDAA